jgi:hypothetical protein
MVRNESALNEMRREQAQCMLDAGYSLVCRYVEVCVENDPPMVEGRTKVLEECE